MPTYHHDKERDQKPGRDLVPLHRMTTTTHDADGWQRLGLRRGPCVDGRRAYLVVARDPVAIGAEHVPARHRDRRERDESAARIARRQRSDSSRSIARSLW